MSAQNLPSDQPSDLPSVPQLNLIPPTPPSVKSDIELLIEALTANCTLDEGISAIDPQMPVETRLEWHNLASAIMREAASFLNSDGPRGSFDHQNLNHVVSILGHLNHVGDPEIWDLLTVVEEARIALRSGRRVSTAHRLVFSSYVTIDDLHRYIQQYLSEKSQPVPEEGEAAEGVKPWLPGISEEDEEETDGSANNSTEAKDTELDETDQEPLEPGSEEATETSFESTRANTPAEE